MKKLSQRGFSPVELLLILLAILLIGGTGWYVWKSSKDNGAKDPYSSSGTVKKEESEKPEAKADPTADWVTYSNKVGSFSLKHPKSWATASAPELCSENLVLFGADANSVGKCATEDGGQINISSGEGNLDDEYALDPAQYSSIKTTVLAVDGIQGSRSEGTAQGQMNGEGPGGLADGTKVVRYVFVANNNRTYQAQYVQASGYPDVLSDFDTMVTKTLKFTP